jgi:hypothetical protein
MPRLETLLALAPHTPRAQALTWRQPPCFWRAPTLALPSAAPLRSRSRPAQGVSASAVHPQGVTPAFRAAAPLQQPCQQRWQQMLMMAPPARSPPHLPKREPWLLLLCCLWWLLAPLHTPTALALPSHACLPASHP